MMDILYVSAMCSPKVINDIHARTGGNPGFAMQKFNRLIAEGLSRNEVKVETLSAIPMFKNNSSVVNNTKNDSYNGVKYHYIPFICFTGLRQVCLFFYTFFFVISWGLKGRKDKRIICDVLNISVCIGALLASKIVMVKSCGIMTDMPGLMAGESKTLGRRLISAFNRSYLGSFDFYVFLTEAMNEKVNSNHKPYIIMEGLVNADELTQSCLEKKYRNKSIIYAGGLFEKYGIKKLIEAFMLVKNPDISLDLYGHGPMVEEIKRYSEQDPRICFHGVAPNEHIVEAERQAMLLINPRPTNELLTRYSFPSKNMEYMVSGTPVLTTALPGMPTEYHQYVYIIDDESISGLSKRITELVNLPFDVLKSKGHNARDFVLLRKNNVYQGRRILNLLSNRI